MSSKLTVIFILLLAIHQLVNAQANQISRDEYFQDYTAALIKSRATPGRHREQTEWFRGLIVSERWVDVLETDSEKNSRFRHESRRGGKLASFETINVGSVEYCRENRVRWRITDKCRTGMSVVPSVNGNSIDTYSKQNVFFGGVEVMLLSANTKFEELDSSGKPIGKNSFTENKVWISKDILILKREYVSGKSPRKIEFGVSETYEYNAKILPIVAPIK